MVMAYVMFFFKQKSAYEMRISDWSSDVCSSDLVNGKYRVTGYDMVANAVIGASTTGMGAFVVADPKYAGTSLGQHHNKMRVVPASAPSPVVTTSDRVGSGALSVADPRPVCLMRPDRDSSVTQGHYGVAD